MKVEYKTSVLVEAGWRAVYIVALAERLSDKRVKVLNVLTIDDQPVGGYHSRTGANRQKFSSDKTAKNEIGKTKNISSLTIIKV